MFKANAGLYVLLATLVQPLAAQAAVRQGAIYASESSGNSIAVLEAGSIHQRERHAFNLAGSATGLCYGGPNDDLYVAVASAEGASVYVATEGGNLHDAVPFATGFSVPQGLDCTSDRVLLADEQRGVFDITAGGDFSDAEPMASVLGAKHVDVFTDSKGTIWLSTGVHGLFDITAGGTLTFSDRHFAYDTGGTVGMLGIAEIAGELHVTEGRQLGEVGRVWNLGGMSAGSGLSRGFEYATGVPYLADALLGVGEHLYVVGHENKCFAGTSVWDVTSGGDMREQQPYTSGLYSNCYALAEMAYVHFCGDAVLRPNSSEQCDTAGDSPGCDSDCTFAQCGDGHLNTEAGEECDDGNVAGGDGCPADCRLEEPAPAPAAVPTAQGGEGATQPLSSEPPAAEPSVGSEPYDPLGGPTAIRARGCSVTGGSAKSGAWSVLGLIAGLLAARRRRS